MFRFRQKIKNTVHCFTVTFLKKIKVKIYAKDILFPIVLSLKRGKGEDKFGYRAEFINLVRLAKSAAALQDTQQ